MSKKTKHLIDLSDIVGFCFECKQCGASISIRASGPIDTSKLCACPNCNAHWLKLETGSSIEDDVSGFFAGLEKLKAKLKNRAEVMKKENFEMALEITGRDPES